MNGKGKVIVVGASAGGMEAFLQLASGLDPALPAAICFVLHISGQAPTMFAKNLSRKSPFPAVFAREGDLLNSGRIYLAPPDRHMVISYGKLRLIRSARENWTRPAIDPLFRSAAAHFGNRAIGVLLTGLLDDGTDGLRAIKRCGGATIVQDPAEASFPDMPQNALNRGSADYVSSLAEMPQLLRQLAEAPVSESSVVPEDLLKEVRFLEQGAVNFQYPEQGWEPTPIACPECAGPLWQRGDGVGPYGCSVGHRFGPFSLMAKQDESVEQSLWAALRLLQERSTVLRQLAEDETGRGHPQVAKTYRDKGAE